MAWPFLSLTTTAWYVTGNMALWVSSTLPFAAAVCAVIAGGITLWLQLVVGLAWAAIAEAACRGSDDLRGD